ncbi:hypothetical protein DN752_21035 [Echinicola strongylocentroti]|uniref:Uncharacterized protein n=1 Tax=Echinicola strongylocentroti TaxID=1795355 RepID=A0A2Z4IP73_9BACT|nr:hypothetical protein [Echinicola strongylocentroti]AWW32428.1 hypothetical protein DN752_21035 [Echinicola strongylocentroti]
MNIQHDTPIPDTLSPFVKKLTATKLVRDDEFTISVKVEYFEDDNNGGFGDPAMLCIENDQNCTADQKAVLKSRYRPFFKEFSTRGNKVDEYGNLVEVDQSGEYPDGSIDEREHWESYLASEVAGITVMEKEDTLIRLCLSNLVVRGRI